MALKEVKEFEINLISQSVKRLFSAGFSIEEILKEISDGILKMTSELTTEELYQSYIIEKSRRTKNETN